MEETKKKSTYRGFTPAQAEANKKYLEKFGELKIRVLPERKAAIQAHASAMGESTAAFMTRAIDQTMKSDLEKQ